MTSPKRVSVVVPTYNRSQFLQRAIDSALRQSHPPHEIIIVDDGSTDDTEARFHGLPAPVRYVKQVNGGVSVARNHGASLATGDWLAFLDSDDVWDSAKLEAQFAAISANPHCGWSITGCHVVNLDDVIVESRRGFEGVFEVFEAVGESPETFFAHRFARQSLQLQSMTSAVFVGDAWGPLFLGNFALPSSALVSRELFERVGGFNPQLRLAEETEFFHRIAAASHVAVVTAPLTHYRVGIDGNLISPANIPTLVENALKSGEDAWKLRNSASEDDRRQFIHGRTRLARRLAWTRLSRYEGERARAALALARSSGDRWDAWSLGVWLSSWMPTSLLGAMHRIKQQIR